MSPTPAAQEGPQGQYPSHTLAQPAHSGLFDPDSHEVALSALHRSTSYGIAPLPVFVVVHTARLIAELGELLAKEFRAVGSKPSPLLHHLPDLPLSQPLFGGLYPTSYPFVLLPK